MRDFLRLFGAVICLMSGSSTANAADDAQTASVKRGEYVAIASDCVACHTAPGGKPFAGGLAIASPVGTIYSSNITPSATAGIGHYTEEQFARALRAGVRADGANLYPAMPYTSYKLLSDADIHDLYMYFQHGVAPVDTVPPPTALPFPMNIRLSMMAWNLVFLGSGHNETDATQSAEWNRGKYLADGAAHCSTRHKWYRQLEQGRAGPLSLNRLVARQGAGGRQHGRGGRAQLLASQRARYRRDRHLHQNRAGIA
jgi:mono/diheme cytochrome c family protein